MIKRQIGTRVAQGLGVLVVVAGIWGWLMLGPPSLADGWRYQVVADHLDAVSALAFDGRGGLYATLEKRRGKGQLIHIQGEYIKELLGGMDKPDGLIRHGDTLYITNESAAKPLISFKEGTVHFIKGVSSAEGIAEAKQNSLLIVEDVKLNGRLLRVDAITEHVEVLLTGLNESEGVCQDKNGIIYIAEKANNQIIKYDQGKTSILLDDLNKPAFLNCLDDGSILITEDKTNFGRLLRYKQGQLEVLMKRLRAPQSAIVDASGSIYIAEQKKDRILKLQQIL